MLGKCINTTFKAFLWMFLLTSMVACEEEEFDNFKAFEKVTLPNYSESGQRVIGCLVNNAPWTIFGKYYKSGTFGSFWKENSVEVDYYSYQDSTITFNIRGRMTRVKDNKYNIDSQLSFGIRTNIKAPGNYFLDSSFPGNMIYHDITNDIDFISDDKNPVVLSIKKFSEQEGIVSGTFVGYLYNRNNSKDSIQIANGIFDVKIPTF